MRKAAFLIGFLVLFAWLGSLDCQAQNFILQGKVTLQDGTPVAEAEIRAESDNPQSGSQKVKTKKDGSYKIPFLRFGVYTFNAMKDGLLTFSQAIHASTKTKQVTIEESRELGPAQVPNKYDIQPGWIVNVDFVMVGDNFWSGTLAIPGNPKASEMIVEANSLTQEGKYAESNAVLDKILEMVKDNAAPYYLKGVNLHSLGQKEAAEAALLKAYELNPKQAGTAAQIGAIAYEEGNKEKALEWFRKELAASPDAVPVLVNIAVLLGEMGKKEEAIASWNKLREMAPEDPNAYVELAAMYTEMGQEDKAIEILNEMERVTRPDPAFWYNIGANFSNRENYVKAEEAYRRALALNPDFPEANRELAYIMIMTGKNAEAAPFIEKYLQARPTADDAKALSEQLEKIRAGQPK